ncbi:hypothetical protein JL721_5479 [Aureococcus anophagefferens]|nr:hypothetical protein JL721_5479 [Aureococcus anophagefferens]
MLYVRALESDVEGWNCSDWTWPAVERRYLEMEDWQGDQGEVDQGWAPASVGMGTPPHHAVGGPLATSGALYRDLLARKFLETVTSPAYGRALPRNFDFNDPDGGRVGAGYYSFNIRDGLRESAAAAMLGGTARGPRAAEGFGPPRTLPSQVGGYAPVKGLDIRAGATVTKLRFGPPDAAGDRAVVGLDVALGADGDAGPKGGAPRTARVALGDGATVVLAAGAVLTPHLLQRGAARSGVGDRTRRGAGLETIVANDGVGVGLQDHPAVAVVYDVDPALTADMAGLYGRFLNWTRGKPFGSYSRAFGYPGFSAGAFLHSGGDETKPPDLQLTVFPVRIEPHLEERREGRASAARVRFDQAIVTVAVVRPDTAYAVVPGGAGPTLELLPHRVPYADGGGINDRDVARLAAGVRRVREIFARAPLRDFVLRCVKTEAPTSAPSTKKAKAPKKVKAEAPPPPPPPPPAPPTIAFGSGAARQPHRAGEPRAGNRPGVSRPFGLHRVDAADRAALAWEGELSGVLSAQCMAEDAEPCRLLGTSLVAFDVAAGGDAGRELRDLCRAVNPTAKATRTHYGVERFNADGEPGKDKDEATTTVKRLLDKVRQGKLLARAAAAVPFLEAAHGLMAPAHLPHKAPCLRCVCAARGAGGLTSRSASTRRGSSSTSSPTTRSRPCSTTRPLAAGVMRSAEHCGGPEDAQPAEIALPMKPYQLMALRWMRSMEELDRGLNGLFWERRDFVDGGCFYYAPDLGEARLEAPPTVHGGLLSDEMGMGKTLEMLSLALVPERCDLRGAGGKKATKREFFVQRRGLERLADHDVVVTTYNALTGPVYDKRRGANNGDAQPLSQIHWHRVVLDEMQMVSPPNTRPWDLRDPAALERLELLLRTVAMRHSKGQVYASGDLEGRPILELPSRSDGVVAVDVGESSEAVVLRALGAVAGAVVDQLPAPGAGAAAGSGDKAASAVRDRALRVLRHAAAASRASEAPPRRRSRTPRTSTSSSASTTGTRATPLAALCDGIYGDREAYDDYLTSRIGREDAFAVGDAHAVAAGGAAGRARASERTLTMLTIQQRLDEVRGLAAELEQSRRDSKARARRAALLWTLARFALGHGDDFLVSDLADADGFDDAARAFALRRRRRACAAFVVERALPGAEVARALARRGAEDLPPRAVRGPTTTPTAAALPRRRPADQGGGAATAHAAVAADEAAHGAAGGDDRASLLAVAKAADAAAERAGAPTAGRGRHGAPPRRAKAALVAARSGDADDSLAVLEDRALAGARAGRLAERDYLRALEEMGEDATPAQKRAVDELARAHAPEHTPEIVALLGKYAKNGPPAVQKPRKWTALSADARGGGPRPTKRDTAAAYDAAKRVADEQRAVWRPVHQAYVERRAARDASRRGAFFANRGSRAPSRSSSRRVAQQGLRTSRASRRSGARLRPSACGRRRRAGRGGARGGRRGPDPRRPPEWTPCGDAELDALELPRGGPARLANRHLTPNIPNALGAHLEAAREVPSAKIARLLRDIDAAIRGKVNEKVVVVTSIKPAVRHVSLALDRAGLRHVTLSRGDSAAALSAAVREWRERDDCAVFVLHAGAAAAGLTLTAAAHLFLLEPFLSVGEEAQAMNRCHRIGQQRDVRTTAYYLRGTVEERLLAYSAGRGRRRRRDDRAVLATGGDATKMPHHKLRSRASRPTPRTTTTTTTATTTEVGRATKTVK